jgi:hypothetical protein
MNVNLNVIYLTEFSKLVMVSMMLRAARARASECSLIIVVVVVLG